ncbi:PTS sugar transporter subunit IIA [Lactobacillus xylocopicola]|uniref:Mannitol-specific phosphotransferase enzyme IIA component n=1 Tax=Lactobacillus xylocopicola TaxID=2976676 RepID=A0ABN6SLS9_9LACO|nr:PTS sugar transporter subunit IIA [Lactobacillus xylocopicola]BDR59976.1 PTS mannitol transporter subunit IIA [Lactobacillus xylocopicola]
MKLDKKMIKLNQHFDTKEDAIRAAGQLLVDNGCVEPGYVNSMLERNKELSTYIGNFIAIPHGIDEGKKYIEKTGISVIQVPEGIEFGENHDDHKVVTVVFGIAGVNNEHLNVLSQIALFCRKVENVAKLADAQSEQEVIDLLKEVEE